MVVRDLLEGALLMFLSMEVVAELRQQLEENRLRTRIAELQRLHEEAAKD